MKAGILTFHNVPNYGAALQAFALCEYLSRRGVEARVIDYKCRGNGDGFLPENRKKSYISSSNILKRLVKSVKYKRFYERAYCEKWRRFRDFSDKFLRVEADGADDYDLLFFGSDQIWNPRITGTLDGKYFGRGYSPRTVRAAYAASCGGVEELSGEARAELISLASGLDFVGVREGTLAELLSHGGVDSTTVVDPTLLLCASDYVEGLSLTPRDGEYVLEYALQNDPRLDEAARTLARERGLRVVKLAGYLEVGGDCVGDAGPLDMPELLAGAKYVLTNSFHGVALSLVFEKDFSAVLPVSRRGRLTELLSALGLSERIVTDGRAVAAPVDYGEVGRRLSPLVAASREYIDRALEAAKDGRI